MAASDNNVPAQIRVVDGCSEAVGDLKDLLVNADAEEVPPAIHLVAWSGSCEDMLSLQKANSSCAVYVGFTAAIGFAKASRELKDCAFDCPLDKILLESDGPNAIPTAAVEFYGKGAFSHCGLVPFAGEGVAACRGASAGLSGVDIVNLASANMKTMFGPTVEGGEGELRWANIVAELGSEAVDDVNVNVNVNVNAGVEEAGEGGIGEIGEGAPPLPPPPPPSKKKKKTKGGKKNKNNEQADTNTNTNNNNKEETDKIGQNNEENEEEFDAEFFADLAV